MNHSIIRFQHIALAAVAVLLGTTASAQTAITSDRFWKGSTGTSMNGYTTFDNDYFYKQGTTRTPNTSKQVSFTEVIDQQNNTGRVDRPTYDLRDTGNDAVKFILGPGQGTIKVYYNDDDAAVTRNFTHTLRVNDSNATLNSNTSRDGDKVIFPAAWDGNGITWSFTENEQIKISSFTLNLPNNNLDGDIARVRIVFRFHNGVSEMSQSEQYTNAAVNQTITLNVDADHQDAYLREIYIQNNSAGSIRVGDCTLTGTLTEQSKPTRYVTTNFKPTDDNATLFGGTTANDNTVLFSGGWTGFTWGITNQTTKFKRFTFTLDNSGIPESERAAVRVVVRYRSHGAEDFSDRWFENGISPDANKTSFVVTPRAGTEDYYVREIYIQNSGAGRINIVQAQFEGEEEVESSNTPSINNSSRVPYSPLTTGNGEYGTKTISYAFNNTANRTEYYVSGGMVGAIEIDFDELTITPTELQPITTDFFWYFNGGGGIWSKGYSNNSRLYRAMRDGNIGAGSVLHQTGENVDGWMYVNGAELQGDTQNPNNRFYTLDSNDAIGFKLDPAKKYRIRIFSDVQNPLYKGNNANSAAQVVAGENVIVSENRVNKDASTWTHTYLYTYDINGSGDIYWIKGSQDGVHLGGFDICPYENIDESLNTVASLPASAFSWFADDVDVQETNQCGSLNNPQVLHTGESGQYVYVYGPTVAINDFVLDSQWMGGHDKKTILLNNGNKIGLKVPAGMTLKFRVAADANVPVIVNHGDTEQSYSNTSNGIVNVEYTSTNAETIWIYGGSDKYVFFEGFTLEPSTINDAEAPVKITDDYIWYSGEVISQSSLFGGNYLANNGVAKTVMPDDQVKVDGNMIGVYDLSRSAESIRLTLDDSVVAGEIRVFYENADLATPEYLDLTANLPQYDWADFHNITGNSGQTITYAYTNNPDSDVEYPARGYRLTPSTGKYDRVTINLNSNPNNFYWHIVVLYDTGNGGASDYTTGTTLSTEIDPERTLTHILIQGAIGKNDIKQIEVGSVVFNRLGTAAGTREVTSLYCGARQADGTATIGKRKAVEGANYITYTFNYNDANNAPTSHDYYIQGGFVAAVEVLKSNITGWGENVTDDLTNGNPNLRAITSSEIENSLAKAYSWKIEQALGTTINNGAAEMVLNGHTMWNNGTAANNDVLIYGDPNWEDLKFGRDLALNTTLVNANKSVLMDKCHAVGIKLQAGGKYKVTAYWAKCDGQGSIYFCSRQKEDNGVTKNYIYPRDHSSNLIAEQKNGQSTFVVDLAGVSLDRVVWISAEDTNPIYFSGFKVEAYKDYSIVIDPEQTGIFTGKYKGPDDTEEKLLVYCSDNGTYESFRAPRVYYIDETLPTSDDNHKIDLTTSGVSSLVKKIELKNATNNPSNPTITADPDASGYYKVSGFEDTDNDRVYKFTFTKIRTYMEGGEEKSETYTDWYYVWYANYLKIGWWTNREAKLIVGSSDSYRDPDHIIVGDFYISSGETADFYYDVINPGKDTSGNVVGYDTAVINGTSVTYGYGEAVFDEAEWTYTTDANSTRTQSRKFAPKATENKANGNPEEFSWTKMNDHKNHLGDGISLAYPVDPSAWNGDEVVKTITFRAKRTGWPDWTAKLTFHFVEAPTLSAEGPTTYKTVTMTRGGGRSTGDIFYTTDGTNPTTAEGVPTNQTYVYDAAHKPTNRQMTVYYAAERVLLPNEKEIYIHNPFTTHIEGKSMSALMTESSNKSRYFLAVSKELEAPVVDPLVEYVSPSRYIISKARDNQLTPTTKYDEWGIEGESQSISALGVGGFLYKYPFAKQYRDVMVQFGNATKRVYRQENNVGAFRNVGVYWGVDDNDAFAEHFDATLYKWKTMGYNYDSTHGGKPADSLGQTEENGNPQTECNGGIGGPNTENGGLWLQPITGDFLRFEPEYDGVITVWIRHNGAAQGDEYYGNITRRPVYVVDENGKVMPRSTVKPTQDHYFGIDGLYGEICTNRSTVRHDCRTDWVNGLASWKRGYENDDAKSLPLRNMATFRLYNYWYGFPLFQNKNRDNHSPRGSSDTNTNRWTMDVADSWVSRTANVKSVQCEFNSIVYHSEYLHSAIENNAAINFTDANGNYNSSKEQSYNLVISSGDEFAKYGWELPAFNVVRYRFPVKAGKTYYMGGRGTKNGYMGMKFEPLPSNYDPADYVTTDYRKLYEKAEKVTVGGAEVDVNAFSAYNHITANGSHAADSYDVETESGRTAALSTYTNTVDMLTTTTGNFTTTNKAYIPTYDIWENPIGNNFNFWYGSSTQGGTEGHANVLFQDVNTTWWDGNAQGGVGNGQRALVNRNSVVGHTCNVRLYRQFTKGYWHPIVLPFSISESRMKEIFGDEVQVLYLDPYNNTMKTNSVNHTVDKDNKDMGSNGQSGQWVSALNPAVSYANLRFTYHHYQMLYANVPAFICPGGKRKVNGQWTADWTTFGSKYVDATGNYDGDPVLIERVTVDRTNLTDNSYNKLGYKIGETENWEYWVTGSYTPGMQGTTDGVYYLTNELTDQGGEQHMRAVIYHSPNGKTLKATRCWIAVRKKSGSDIPYGKAPLLTNVSFGGFDGEEYDDFSEAGIEDIIMDDDPAMFDPNYVSDDNVYDVMGRIVGKGSLDGLRTGVYLFHGEKVYIR